MKIFDKLKVDVVYTGDILRKAFPGIDSTFTVNYDPENSNLKKIINNCNRANNNLFIFVFVILKKQKKETALDLATHGEVFIALKADKFLTNDLHTSPYVDEDIKKIEKNVKGFYRQGSYLSQIELASNFKLVYKKEGVKLKPNTKKHFGDIMTGLNFNESYRSILKENMDYLDIGAITKGEQDFVRMAAEDLLNAAYNNKALNREGYVGILLKMGNLFEKATGFALPDAFVRKFFYVYPTTSYYGDGNQRQYVLKNYIDKYKLNLLLPQTGGFWIFSVVNSLIFKLIDHHKRKEIYSIILPLLSRYFISGLHELADIVVTDALFSKNEIEKLKNYFVRRKLKPETDKHFGDILTSL